ncbi:MAG: hypothetical protein P4L38_12690 [Syntrophaceae bacterium]|nr:hypothetical protein [Syntrophaceae bacterium]
MSVFIKLRNESGFFVDPETGFSLSFDQKKPLPDNLGKRTRDWISGGGLVKIIKDETFSSSSPQEWGEEDHQTQATEEPQANDNNLENRFNGLSVSDLRKLCKDLGLTYGRKQDKVDLINLIITFEAKANQ